MADRDRRRRGRRPGVLRLNQGSSPYGRSSSMSLNRPGGSFMAGRPAGGGVGAATSLLQGLGLGLASAPGLTGMSPGQSQQGPSGFNVGPPPVTPSPVAPPTPSTSPHIPTFSPPSTTSIASSSGYQSLFPSFQPILQDPRRRFF